MTDTPAVKTYRYLRISMVGAVVLLGVSILIERSELSCWQTSVSAYYYTPARAVFVGVLMAIGLCLIVIKGSTAWEDATLNAAGMLAPVVAVVPTTDVGECWSQSPGRLPGRRRRQPRRLGDREHRQQHHGAVDHRHRRAGGRRDHRQHRHEQRQGGRRGGRRRHAAGAGGGDGVPARRRGLFVLWDDFNTRAHGIAAVLMFFFLALAVGGNAWDRRGGPAPRTYFWLYASIAAAMVIAPAIMFPLGSGWRHMVLALEATEIALFAVFWLVQTREHWDETV
jgi:hypothetical protein